MYQDLDSLKARLPVTYLLHIAGEEPVERQGRDILYKTPWRNDSNASLACYPSEDNGIVDRWKDMARSDSGDILDLIGMIDPSRTGFHARMELARTAYDHMVDDVWVAPEPLPVTGSFDVEEARAELGRLALASDTDELTEWLSRREDYVRNIPAQWLRARFGVVTVGREIRAPYGDTGLYKYRNPGEKFMSPAGTRGMWTSFYGEHLDVDDARPVVLCEGEPDVWSGTHSTRDYVFLGLPTGAGTRPEKLQSRLVGRRVLIALDADTAGRDATDLWSEHLLADGCDVSIVPLPEGSDLSDLSDIPLMLSKARRFTPRLPGLIEVAGTLRRANRNGDPGQAVADFVLSPLRVMIGENGGLSYEVDVSGRAHLLTMADLGSKSSFTKWSADKGQSWTGSDTDVGVLRNNLAVDSLFVPTEEATDVEGWHEGQFVWSGGYIGARPMRYVPTAVHAGLDVRLDETDRPLRGELEALLALGDTAVVHPMVAWCAAAPWRDRFDRFPILNVAGASGSGKTTLLEQIIPRITGSYTQHTLTSTTKFAVEATIASTNAFPVVFDEYRPGARTDSLQALEQLVRDVYDGQSSMKSKGGDRWMETQEIRTKAPLVVAGEQSISETSHAERMTLVHLTRPDVRPGGYVKALHEVRGFEPRIARSYLSWIVYRAEDAPPIFAADRVEYNMAMLRFGWATLRDWAWDMGWHDVLPSEPDLSGVAAATAEVTASNPVKAAVQWALGDKYASDHVWIEGDELFVSVASFVADVNRNGTFVLPGNNGKTISDFLARQYGAVEGRRAHPEDYGSKRKMVWVVPVSRIFPDEVN